MLCFIRRALCALCAASVLPLHAQTVVPPSRGELDVVVVTAVADRDGPTLSQPNLRVAKERIENTPGGVGIIDTETLLGGRVSTLTDTFRYAAGVYAQPRFGAEETRLSIRGSGLQRTFHLRGIKLMQDGVPLNQADGGGDFQSIEPLATRYMEVYRGANALQYGGTTLGGAINYVSRTGYDASPLTLRAEAGSFDYLRSQAAVAGVAGDWDYYATFSTFDQEGFRDHATQESSRINTNAGYRIHDDLETRFYFAWATSNSELPGSLTKAQLKDDPSRRNPLEIAQDRRRDTDQTRISNSTVWRFGEARLEVGVFYSNYQLWHPIGSVIEQDADNVGASLRYVNETKLAGHRNEFVAGFIPTRGKIQDDQFQNIGGERGLRTDRRDLTASNLDFYAQNSFWLDERWAAVLGLQYSRAQREVEDLFFSPGNDTSYDRSFHSTSPKIGVLYAASPGITWFANISKSFEPPSFSEAGVADTATRAQTAWTYEVGTRGDLKGLQWDLALYRAEVRDELLNISLPSGLTGTLNAPRTVHEGVEAAASGILGAFHWQTAALLNRFRFDDDAIYGDNTLPGIPKLLLRAELLYHTDSGLYFGPNVEWSPRKYPIDMANSFDADPYAVWGVKLGQDVNKQWSWFVEARNLFDKKYAATTGVVRDAGGADAPQFLPGDGRSVYAGLQWRM